MNRTENIVSIQSQEFDICIIGGGASGTGCALDAALRGLQVALVEKEDFASGTSSKSTKLIHGGVRYLEQAFKNFDFAQLRQVRHGLEERHIVLKNAPHLAKPLALITPVNSWIEGLYFTIGLKIYGWFARHDSLPSSAWLSKKETLEHIPTLNQQLHSSVMYYDGQLDDARYCLALAQTAAKAGAKLANHVSLIKFLHNPDGQITKAILFDQINNQTFEVKAKIFINCTGPYSDAVRQLANKDLENRIRPSKGVHLILPFEVLSSDKALLIPKTPDGRVVFALPFEGKTLLGTTDKDYDALEIEPELEHSEVEFLLATLQPYIQEKLHKNQVLSGFGGLRPLIKPPKGNKTTQRLVRDHEVEYDEVSGLVSLLGGKWTTYRLMAKDTIDFVAQKLQNNQACTTENEILVGAENYYKSLWKAIVNTTGLGSDSAQHLASKYGSNAHHLINLMQTTPNLQEKILSNYPFVKAEVIWSMREEMACTIRDFLARRIRLEILDWQAAKAAAPVVADLMGEELGWSAEMQARYLAEYEKGIAHHELIGGL
jgi:glycerol-3-phosphate dehydrogenase